MPVNFHTVYTLLHDLTPLKVDCGTACDAACCKESGEDSGMLLFPGEKEFLEAHFSPDWFLPTQEGGWLLSCKGECDRRWRPLSCRIFPLFPLLCEDGRVRVAIDPRAWRVCPLARVGDGVAFQTGFIRRVRQVGRLLTADDDCRRFLKEQSTQLQEWGALLPNGLQTPSKRRKAD